MASVVLTGGHDWQVLIFRFPAVVHDVASVSGTKLYRASAGFRGVCFSTIAESWLSISCCILQSLLHLTVSNFANEQTGHIDANFDLFTLPVCAHCQGSLSQQLASCHHSQLCRSNCGLVMTAINSARAMSTEAQLTALPSPQPLPPKRYLHHCSSYCFVPCC